MTSRCFDAATVILIAFLVIGVVVASLITNL
jgi:hypothetical protein